MDNQGFDYLNEDDHSPAQNGGIKDGPLYKEGISTPSMKSGSVANGGKARSSSLSSKRSQPNNLEEEMWKDILKDDKQWKEMTSSEKSIRVLKNIAKIFCVLGCLYFFICALELLSSAFQLMAGQSTGNIMDNEYITNPVVGLIIGVLVTVLVQSSSTSTSIIVSMVSADIITVEVAIPMVMGANIGTSVTNTIVSITQAGDREQFRRAFAGATVHDMFNWLAVAALLPLEILTGMLEKLTAAIVEPLEQNDGADLKMISAIIDPFTELIIQTDSQIKECWGMGFLTEEESMIVKYCEYEDASTTSNSTISPNYNSSTIPTEEIPEACIIDDSVIGIPHSCNFLFYETEMSDQLIGGILLLMALFTLCTALIIMVKLLNSMLKGSIAKTIQTLINAKIPYVPWLTGYIAILVGALLTFVVQSSSVFTSMLTPLIGVGLITVSRAYPLTLGANIGTTTTALLAAMASTGNKTDAIQIALVHLFFNIFAIMIYYPIPFMRFPIPMCKKLGKIVSHYRWFAIAYLVGMFFIFPSAIFALSLGGPIVFWSIFAPALGLLIIVAIINAMQSKIPEKLPKILQNWDFLPEPLHSLAPYDKMVTKCSCCKKCTQDQTNKSSDIENSLEAGSRL